MPGRLIIVFPEGTKNKVHLPTRPTLEALRAAIGGGWIQPIKARYEGKIREAYVDEEGQLKNLPPNPTARELIASAHNTVVNAIVSIVGPLVIWIPDPRSNKNGNG